MQRQHLQNENRKFAVATTITREYRRWLAEALERHPSITQAELLRRAIEGDGLVAEIAKLDADAAVQA